MNPASSGWKRKVGSLGCGCSAGLLSPHALHLPGSRNHRASWMSCPGLPSLSNTPSLNPLPSLHTVPTLSVPYIHSLGFYSYRLEILKSGIHLLAKHIRLGGQQLLKITSKTHPPQKMYLHGCDKRGVSLASTAGPHWKLAKGTIIMMIALVEDLCGGRKRASWPQESYWGLLVMNLYYSMSNVESI